MRARSLGRREEIPVSDVALTADAGAVRLPKADRPIAGFAAAVLLIGGLWLGELFGWRQGALYLLGGGLGFALYHAAFGFTSAFRVLLTDGRGAGLRAQMLMLALAALVFFP